MKNSYLLLAVLVALVAVTLGIFGILTKATPTYIHIDRVELQAPETDGVKFVLENVTINATSRTLDWMLLLGAK